MIAKIQNKKGFTLVEVIVVLIILAILAAILVPALTGYIDRANERAAIAEARAFLMGAQTVISEDYGVNGGPAADTTIAAEGAAASPNFINTAKELAEVDGTVTNLVYSTRGKVQSFTYVANGFTVNYTVADGLVVAP